MIRLADAVLGVSVPGSILSGLWFRVISRDPPKLGTVIVNIYNTSKR